MTKDKVEVGTNALTLPFPSDPQGALRTLKAGGIDAAKRVNGNRDRMTAFLKTLEVIKEHGIARFKADNKARKDAKTNQAAAKVRVGEKLKRQAEEKATAMEAHAKRLRLNAGIVPDATEAE
jgi:hypothetical protein